jgi:hypothetical protein
VAYYATGYQSRGTCQLHVSRRIAYVGFAYQITSAVVLPVGVLPVLPYQRRSTPGFCHASTVGFPGLPYQRSAVVLPAF